MLVRRLCLLFAILLAASAHAAPAPFDLSGPTLDVVITRGAQILPASEVPNLAVGDRIWIKADLPSTQSANYLMVAAFLSGSTNPPPESWFFPCKTWTGKCAREGLSVTVPPGAQQVIVFLAPETSGDFRTLVSAVRGRPGAFVRASQDLNQAALDRSRLDHYLSTIHQLDSTDPYKLKDVAPLLARSLAIKVDEKCLDRLAELQAPCLMSGQESLILNDGHSTSIVQALTAGPGADLVMEASVTPQLGFGIYSPYIASVIDIARILDSFRTAQYQYIPALASQRGDKLALTLNAAPSFHDPKSVLVIALPAVEQSLLPPLHAVNPTEIYCASRTALVLPVEGAPLVFSTGYAHDLTLSVTGIDGKTINLPAKADGAQGGYIVDTSRLKSATLGETVHASLQGYWGFEPYAGPGFQLRNAHAKAWVLADGDEDALIVGRQDTVHLQADSVSCVDGIMLKDPAGKELQAEWKAVKPNQVEVKLPLQDAQPGAMTLLITQYGVSQPQLVPLKTFSAAGRLDAFSIHAGDSQGILKGGRLDEVASLSIGNIVFLPGALSTRAGSDALPMIAQDAQAVASLKPDPTVVAKVTLKDGRVVALNASVDAPRPRVSLIGKSVQASHASGDSNIQLANQDELPQDARLTFSVRAQSPSTFTRDQTIEIATADESFSASLSLSNGGITLGDARVAVATLDPAKAFGSSAFGPLKFRVLANAVAGDWQPLATLVRLPALKDLKCPATPELACRLSGSGLFLVDSVSSDPQFEHAVQVPDGFPGSTLPVPRPSNGRLYVKLRDDPSVVNTVALEAQQLPPSADELARAAATQEAASPKPETIGGANPPAAGGAASSPAAPVPPPAASSPPQ
ncbi:MAG: putative lipoprotein [Nevskia sp.]|nr:putative lipoprotein [Nevskia sp.]